MDLNDIFRKFLKGNKFNGDSFCGSAFYLLLNDNWKLKSNTLPFPIVLFIRCVHNFPIVIDSHLHQLCVSNTLCY